LRKRGRRIEKSLKRKIKIAEAKNQNR